MEYLSRLANLYQSRIDDYYSYNPDSRYLLNSLFLREEAVSEEVVLERALWVSRAAPPNNGVSLCRVLDRFMDVYRSVDFELRVESECRNPLCSICPRDIASRLKSSNLRLKDFRDKMVLRSQEIIVESDLRPAHGRDCGICFESISDLVVDLEQHCDTHPFCRSCFVRNGRSTCPYCRAELSFRREIADYLEQMASIDRGIRDNEEAIDYLDSI
jgi:hypothetical protein